MNRNRASKYKPKGKAALISITNPYSKKFKLYHPETRYLGILELRFDDTNEDDLSSGFHPMSLNDAFSSVEFILKHKDQADEFVFHCEAGMSRSAGAAAAACQILGIKDDVCYEKNRFPNILVKRKMLEAWSFIRERDGVKT